MSGLYEKFHGAKPRCTRKVNLTFPRKGERLVKVGRLISLVYEPEYPSERRNTYFEHRFGDFGYKFDGKHKPILAVSKDGKHLFIIGGKYIFNIRGIVG